MPDQQAFIEFIKSNEGIIFKIAKVYAEDEEDLKDLYQEIVYHVWKSFDSFRGESKRSTWMYRIALNTSITHQKMTKRKPYESRIDLQNFHFADEQHEATEQIEVMYGQIKALNKVEKGLILLFLDGKSYEEISSITGFTTSNVGTKLNRIKQKLKENIKKRVESWN